MNEPHPEHGPDSDPAPEPGRRRDLAGLFGWGLLLIVAAALLLSRLLGGGGGC